MEDKQQRTLISRGLANCPDGYRFRAHYAWVDEISEASECHKHLMDANADNLGPGWRWVVYAWARDSKKSLDGKNSGFKYFPYASGFATDLHGAFWAAKASVQRKHRPFLFHGIGERSDVFLKALERERVEGPDRLHEEGFEDLRDFYHYQRPAPPPSVPPHSSLGGLG